MTIKCDKCNGDGFVLDENGEAHDCDKCYCCGYIDVETNEEWLRQASTEELAEWIYQLSVMDRINQPWYFTPIRGSQKIVEWLKQPKE